MVGQVSVQPRTNKQIDSGNVRDEVPMVTLIGWNSIQIGPSMFSFSGSTGADRKRERSCQESRHRARCNCTGHVRLGTALVWACDPRAISI